MHLKPRSWVELNPTAFEHNIKSYKSIIGDNTKLSVVIKANAYGHDTVCAAQLCQNQPLVDWICINSLSEALLVRKHGITKPMLVISSIDAPPVLAIKNNIDLIGYSFEQIKELNDCAATCNEPISIHLKLDTGMSRLGFFPEQLLAYIDEIKKMPFIIIQGIFTHFAESSKADLSFTNHQANIFKKTIKELQKKNIEIPLRHFSNSAATPLITLECANMVRLGAGPFGLYPSAANKMLSKKEHPSFKLKPILAWKTKIFHIKKIPAGRFVGYSRTYTTNRPTTLGFLPLGYHEGLNFELGNKGVVWFPKQAQYAPIIGLICMNITMIDLTDIKNVSENDEIVLVGQEKLISPETIAALVGTNNIREITSNIVYDIPRIIVPENVNIKMYPNVKDINHVYP